ncbi:MAG TPA: STAS domain-containing protein [Tepidisphaeraceae bacterium]|nr:STAS domain-containing protein [Tepidisphaeraceae bacterium]
MEITEQRQGAVTVVKPAGALTADHADRLRSTLAEAARANLGRVVVDASAVPFLDSRGIEVLLDVGEELGHGGRALKMSGVTPTVREALELTGVSDAMEFYDDVHSAVRSFL